MKAISTVLPFSLGISGKFPSLEVIFIQSEWEIINDDLENNCIKISLAEVKVAYKNLKITTDYKCNKLEMEVWVKSSILATRQNKFFYFTWFRFFSCQPQNQNLSKRLSTKDVKVSIYGRTVLRNWAHLNKVYFIFVVCLLVCGDMQDILMNKKKRLKHQSLKYFINLLRTWWHRSRNYKPNLFPFHKTICFGLVFFFYRGQCYTKRSASVPICDCRWKQIFRVPTLGSWVLKEYKDSEMS